MLLDILYTGTYGLFYRIIESLTVDRWNLSFPQQIHLCFSPFLSNSQLLIHSVTWRFAFPSYLMFRFGMVLVMVIATSDLLDDLFYWINLSQYTLVALCKSTLHIIRLVLFMNLWSDENISLNLFWTLWVKLKRFSFSLSKTILNQWN